LRAETSVKIGLQEQMAYLLQNGRPVLASPISSGRYGPLSKTGSFTILEKKRSHYSSMYGKIVDATGNTYQSQSRDVRTDVTASTTYHFRIVATNSSGTTYGSDRPFTTTP
jgi:L,D-transpeptidase catalytic domain